MQNELTKLYFNTIEDKIVQDRFSMIKNKSTFVFNHCEDGYYKFNIGIVILDEDVLILEYR